MDHPESHGSRNPGRTGLFRVLCALILPLCLSGCELLAQSLAEYFLDNTVSVEITEVTGKTRTALMPSGTILIPPGTEGATVIGLGLDNPRNLTVRRILSNSAPVTGTLETRQPAAGEIEIEITGAAEWEDYLLTLALQSPDGLRDFEAKTIALKCVSFETGLQDLRVGSVHPAFGKENTFVVGVHYDTESIELEAVTLAPASALTEITIHKGEGVDASSPSGLSSAIHTVTYTVPSLNLGNNFFYLLVKTPSLSEKGYLVNIFRGLNDAKDITEFYFKIGEKYYGYKTNEPAAETGSGSMTGTNISVTVPHGTTPATLSPNITHTGISVSPASGAPHDFSGADQTYTVTAMDGTAKTYTVRVTVEGRVDFTFSGPEDEAFELGAVPDLKWKDNDSLNLEVDGDYAEYQWYLDDSPLEGETLRSLVRDARDFSIGVHTISVRVKTSEDVFYSKEVTFNVVTGL